MTNLQQGFPQLSSPIALSNGNVTQPWLQFFIALWNRTGQALGILDGSEDSAIIALLSSSSQSIIGDTAPQQEFNGFLQDLIDLDQVVLQTLQIGNRADGMVLSGDVTGSGIGNIVTIVAKIAGTTVSGTTGTTNVVFSNSPTLVTPVIGAATGTSLSVSGALTSTTGVLTISGTGTSTISGPLSIAGASAGQIVFPATQNPSSNANTLDDYEEGTWTPSITFVTPGDLVVAYTTQVGDYTKIGRDVRISIQVITSTFTHTTSSGNLLIQGFPFAAATLTGQVSQGSCQWQGITKANYTDMVIALSQSVSIASMQTSGSGQSVANIASADMPTGGTVRIGSTMTYPAS